MHSFLKIAGKWIALGIVPLLAATLSHAQATRTWVSGVGDDANPCSRTAPCKTWAGAISKTAAGGEICALDPGGYGALTITKAITLSGDGTLASTLVAGTNGIVVAAGVNDVVILRNFEIQGLAQTASPGVHGVSFLSGAELHLDRMLIYGFAQQGVNFAPSGVSSLFVTNSSIRNNTGGGIYSVPGGSGTAFVSVNGSYIQGNGRGMRSDDGTTVTVESSSISGNSGNGFIVAASSRPVNGFVSNSNVSNNALAGIYAQSATVRLSNVTITGNTNGLLASAVGVAVIASYGNNHVGGNTTDGAPTLTLSPM